MLRIDGDGLKVRRHADVKPIPQRLAEGRGHDHAPLRIQAVDVRAAEATAKQMAILIQQCRLGRRHFLLALFFHTVHHLLRHFVPLSGSCYHYEPLFSIRQLRGKYFGTDFRYTFETFVLF